MKRWWIRLTTLTAVLATAGGVTAFALSGQGDETTAPEGADAPNSSAVCAQDTPDCNDMIVPPLSGSEADEGIAVGEPHPDGRGEDEVPSGLPATLPPVDPAKEIDPDGIEPVETPTLEPGDADVYGKEVPIGTFDQDGDSPASSGSGEDEGAPIEGGVAAGSGTTVTAVGTPAD